jgi:hypothetical protein
MPNMPEYRVHYLQPCFSYLYCLLFANKLQFIQALDTKVTHNAIRKKKPITRGFAMPKGCIPEDTLVKIELFCGSFSSY